MAEWIDAVAVDALAVGEKTVVSTTYCDIALFHLDDGFYAIEDRCSHDGGELASGVCEGGEIICPRHGAHFCIRDGRALTPPAYEDITAFAVRVDHGMVQIDIDA